MPQLYHYPLCPFSRRIRLALGEYGASVDLKEETPWSKREEFLALNPTGEIPVLVDNDGSVAAGIYAVSEYLDELYSATSNVTLLPGTLAERAEARRLVDWFDHHFYVAVTANLITEKVYKRFMTPEQGGGEPDMLRIRHSVNNISGYMQHIDQLATERSWLAGDHISLADLSAAAHVSCIDFLGDVPWHNHSNAKDWYARIKSRPSFRPLLADQIRGLTPVTHYADLDF